MKRRKYLTVLLIILAVLFSGAISIYKYMYRPHRNIGDEDVKASLSAKTLIEEFTNETYENWADKVVEISGIVTVIEDETTFIMDNSVLVDLGSEQTTSNLKIGFKTIVKGRCVGYDDLLEIVKIDQAIIIKP